MQQRNAARKRPWWAAAAAIAAAVAAAGPATYVAAEDAEAPNLAIGPTTLWNPRNSSPGQANVEEGPSAAGGADGASQEECGVLPNPVRC
jgi:hypothetical protein